MAFYIMIPCCYNSSVAQTLCLCYNLSEKDGKRNITHRIAIQISWKNL